MALKMNEEKEHNFKVGDIVFLTERARLSFLSKRNKNKRVAGYITGADIGGCFFIQWVNRQMFREGTWNGGEAEVWHGQHLEYDIVLNIVKNTEFFVLI